MKILKQLIEKFATFAHKFLQTNISWRRTRSVKLSRHVKFQPAKYVYDISATDTYSSTTQTQIGICSICGMNCRLLTIKKPQMCKMIDERAARKYRCDECGKAFSHKDKVRRNVKNIHNGELWTSRKRISSPFWWFFFLFVRKALFFFTCFYLGSGSSDFFFFFTNWFLFFQGRSTSSD